MKSIEYVRRYGQRLLAGDLDAGIEMAQLLMSETNSEYACRCRCGNKTERLKMEILEKYTRKGNTIRELFMREYHRNVLNEDWFRHVVTVTRESS